MKHKTKNASFWKNFSQVKIDLGCGENKHPGFVGVDFREGPQVDVAQDLSLYPWKEIPSDIADIVFSSHLNEHINPDPADPRLAALIDLLLGKKLITVEEIQNTVGDYRFLGGFIRFMDEVWRITKPGGQFMSSHPFAPSSFYVQDPSHINPINQLTYAYFDPLAVDPITRQPYHLYEVYRPLPWKLVTVAYQQNGFMEVLLEKRKIDTSYKVSSLNGLKIN